MTFDEQLKRAFDTLADRLREHIAGELRGAAADLAASAQTDRETAVATASAEAREAAQKDARKSLEAAVATASAEAREAAQEDARKSLEAAVATASAEAREAADDARKSLEAAVATARVEAREAAQEDARKSLDAAVALERASLKTADLATSQRLLEAIRAIDHARSLSEILDTLVSCAGREASRAGILLVRAGQLRGWRFIGFGPALDAANEIELPLHDSGLIAEAVRTGAAVSSDTSGRTAAPAFAELPDGRQALAVPIPMGGQVVGVLYADQGLADNQRRASAITWPDTLEVMARHSARCLEALTAFRAARVLTERPDVSPGTASDQPDLVGSHGGRADEDPEDASESARRYARLLVSEIKLYHEAAVIAGRRERDLATRLAAEIARARVLYEQRVAAPVRQNADYFQAELVRTLANGDAKLLGQTT
jgi:chemotaxis protein histidine kinase CheA